MQEPATKEAVLGRNDSSGTVGGWFDRRFRWASGLSLMVGLVVVLVLFVVGLGSDRAAGSEGSGSDVALGGEVATTEAATTTTAPAEQPAEEPAPVEPPVPDQPPAATTTTTVSTATTAATPAPRAEQPEPAGEQPPVEEPESQPEAPAEPPAEDPVEKPDTAEPPVEEQPPVEEPEQQPEAPAEPPAEDPVEEPDTAEPPTSTTTTTTVPPAEEPPADEPEPPAEQPAPVEAPEPAPAEEEQPPVETPAVPPAEESEPPAVNAEPPVEEQPPVGDPGQGQEVPGERPAEDPVGEPDHVEPPVEEQPPAEEPPAEDPVEDSDTAEEPVEEEPPVEEPKPVELPEKPDPVKDESVAGSFWSADDWWTAEELLRDEVLYPEGAPVYLAEALVKARDFGPVVTDTGRFLAEFLGWSVDNAPKWYDYLPPFTGHIIPQEEFFALDPDPVPGTSGFAMPVEVKVGDFLYTPGLNGKSDKYGFYITSITSDRSTWNYDVYAIHTCAVGNAEYMDVKDKGGGLYGIWFEAVRITELPGEIYYYVYKDGTTGSEDIPGETVSSRGKRGDKFEEEPDVYRMQLMGGSGNFVGCPFFK